MKPGDGKDDSAYQEWYGMSVNSEPICICEYADLIAWTRLNTHVITIHDFQADLVNYLSVGDDLEDEETLDDLDEEALFVKQKMSEPPFDLAENYSPVEPEEAPR